MLKNGLLVMFMVLISLRSSASEVMQITCGSVLAIQNEMDLIAANLANIQTTRTPTGGPYRPYKYISCTAEACLFDRKLTPLMRYEPSHPDADLNGYVAYPDVDVMFEMQSMIDASNRFEAEVRICKASQN